MFIFILCLKALGIKLPKYLYYLISEFEYAAVMDKPYTAFIHACDTGNILLIKRLEYMLKHVDLHGTLVTVLNRGYLSIAEIILKSDLLFPGLDMVENKNEVFLYYETKLYNITDRTASFIYNILKELGKDPLSPLFVIVAAKSGNEEFISRFESYKLQKINLYYYDAVELLIKKGVKNWYGFFTAIKENNLAKFVQLFNLRPNNSGVTSVFYNAVKLKRWAFVEILEKTYICYNTCFKLACEQNNLELIKYFIKKDVDVGKYKIYASSTICKLYLLFH